MDSKKDMDNYFAFLRECYARPKTELTARPKKYLVKRLDDWLDEVYCMYLLLESCRDRDKTTELSRYLTRSDGVEILFEILVDLSPDLQMDATLNKRLLRAAGFISQPSELCMPYHDYCDNISRQLYPFLIHPNTLYCSFAAIIIKALLESPHAINKKPTNLSIQREIPKIFDIVLGPILEPLTGADSKINYRISHTILALQNLLQNHLPGRLLLDHFPSLFNCLVSLTRTKLGICLEQCLGQILKDLQPGPACCLLEKAMFHDCANANTYKKVEEGDAQFDELSIKLTGDNNEAKAEAESQSPSLVVLSDTASVILSILEMSDNDPYVTEYFFHFQEKMWTYPINEDITRRCANLIARLLSQPRRIRHFPDRPDLKATIITDIEKAQERISKTLAHYLNFVRALYQEQDQDEKKCEDESTSENVQDLAVSSLDTCLDLVQLLATTYKATAVNNTAPVLSQILPILRDIKAILEVGTHTERQKTATTTKLVQTLNNLIEALTSGELICSPATEQDNQMHKSQREHQSIMEDFKDELAPVRLHAIARMKQMLIINDEYALEMIIQSYKMVESSLAYQEPYVFSASIDLLAEMALREPDKILPLLIGWYARKDIDVQQQHHRIKLGEMLAGLMRRINMATPHHAAQILDALLERAVSEPQELVRMSIVTSIGVICAQLDGSLRKSILDILVGIRNILDSTDTIQTKRAAVISMRTTIESLEQHNVESIGLDWRTIYALLEKARLEAEHTHKLDLEWTKGDFETPREDIEVHTLLADLLNELESE